jgi:hypothetical protein
MGWFEYLLCDPQMSSIIGYSRHQAFGVSLIRAVDATHGWPFARGARYRGPITNNDAFWKFVREKITLTIFAALEMWDTSNTVDRPPYGWLFHQKCMGQKSVRGSLNPLSERSEPGNPERQRGIE